MNLKKYLKFKLLVFEGSISLIRIHNFCNVKIGYILINFYKSNKNHYLNNNQHFHINLKFKHIIVLIYSL